MRSVVGVLLGAAVAAVALASPVVLENRFDAFQLGGMPIQMEYDTGARQLVVLTPQGAVQIEIPQGTPRVVETRQAGERQTVAPGGGSLLELEPSGGRWVALGVASPPPAQVISGLPERVGDASVSVGQRGRFGALGRRLDALDGRHGRWEWTFFTASQVTTRVVTAERRWPVADRAGTVVALVGGSRLSVYDAAGRLVVEIPGHYRKVALSSEARVVLLNPYDRSRSVLIVSGAHRASIDAGEPVHGIRLSPNGKRAVIWFRDGMIQKLDPVAGTLGRKVRLPRDGPHEQMFISSLYLEDDGTATVGLLTRTGPRGLYNRGGIAQVRNGRVLWNLDHPVARPASTIPEVLPIGEGRVAVRDFEGVSIYRSTGP